MLKHDAKKVYSKHKSSQITLTAFIHEFIVTVYSCCSKLPPQVSGKISTVLCQAQNSAA
jgi:hypothetical protein